MSVLLRLISGTAAAWLQIGVTLITQLILVPMYLSCWDVHTYAMWLAIQALSVMLTSLDLGFQEYIGFEFLKFGKRNQETLSRYLCSGLLIGFAMGMLQLLLVTAALLSGTVATLIGEVYKNSQGELIYRAGLVLLMQSFAWLICGSIGGVLTRAVSAFGHYHRMAWWGVCSALVMNIAPAIAVLNGAGLLLTGSVVAAVRILADIPVYIDMLRLLRKEGISLVRPSLKLGWNIFMKSIFLSVTGLFENLRQQGARLLLTPFTGAAGLAAFSTMRTGANVAMQGLHTITFPLMPELMSFVHKRDQAKMEAAFGTVWMVSIALLAPALVLMQVIVEPLYTTWTRGQIPFNHWFFAIISTTILVYGISQPASAVVKGNNLLRQQLLIAAVTALLAFTVILLLVPPLGITGAGIALLTAEIGANMALLTVAKRWLQKNGLKWAEQPFYIALTSVCMAGVAMGLIVILPQYKWLVFLLSTFLLCCNCWRYWQILPLLSGERARQLFFSLPLLRFLFQK